MAFDASSLEARIYEILRAPDVDFESISAKRVRAQLAEEQPDLASELREHKKAVDEIVLQAYHTVKLDRDQVNTPTATASSSAAEDDDDESKPPQSSAPVPLKKAAKKKEDFDDAEYAQQLHDQINGGRATRNGGATRKKKVPASGGGSRKKFKLSEDIVVDSDEEAESGSDVKPAKKTRKRKAKASDDDEEHKPKKKRGGGGFNKPWTLSSEMATVCGVDHCSRPQVVKRIWDYIRSNELQNPKDKRQIKCDENLLAVMGCKTVTAFSMNKYIGKHLYPLADGAVVAPDLETTVKEDEKEEPLAKEEPEGAQEDGVKAED